MSSREKESPSSSSASERKGGDEDPGRVAEGVPERLHHGHVPVADVRGGSGREIPMLSRHAGMSGRGEEKGDRERPLGARTLKRASHVTTGSRNSSIQKFVLPSERSQIPFEPSRTSTLSLAAYLHMENPRLYPRKSTTMLDRLMARLFRGCASSRSPWIHSRANRSLIGIPIMRPDSLIVHAWTLVITLVDLTYTAFLVPLSIAFDTTKQGTTLTWLTITDIVGTSFYAVDMVMEFHTGFVAAYDIRRQLVLRRGFVAENYIRRGAFFVDFVCILYVFLITFLRTFVCGEMWMRSIAPELAGALIPSAEGQVFKILFFFRLLRLLRVFRLLAGSSGVHFLVSPISGPVLRVMNTATFFLLNVLFTMLVFINLLGCMWWFTAEMEGLENSWVAYAGVNFDVTTASAAAQYVTSVYFAMTIITTVGFGDITPQTVAEMLVAMVFMGVGLFYFGYIVSAVSSLVHMINAQARGTQKVRQKLEEIDMWASSRHISGHLRHQLKTYYMEVWAPHCGAQLDDSSQFQELPAALRAELVLSMSGGALRQSYMLSALDLDLVEFLATLGLPSPLIAGHDLYTEGEAASKFWVLQEGELTVMRGISKIGTIVGPAVIGQAAIFSNLLDDCQRRMHTMRAAVNCTLWEFSGSTFSYMLRYRPKVLVRLCLRYRDHLMHLKKKFRNRTPQRIDRMIERLGLIAHAISNDEPFLGAEGVELHIRDPEALDASNGSIASVESRNDSFMSEEDEDSRLGRLFDAPGGPNQKDGNDSPLREDSHNFNVSLAANRSLERMNTMIDAARAFAGEPDWDADDWPESGPIPREGSPRASSPRDPRVSEDALESGLGLPQQSGFVEYNPSQAHLGHDV